MNEIVSYPAQSARVAVRFDRETVIAHARTFHREVFLRKMREILGV